ncbi:anti-phage dCTP deaminase [Xanthobacter wiegelii]|uniref:anti-phage dCTP deaminase n=1 Tax=Xanthobacter wiegelii TaxID=3119913 RepID=UPI003727E460
MTPVFAELEYPELFFGFVAPIGADLKGCVSAFKAKLEGFGYKVVEIKVTEIFADLAKSIRPDLDLKKKPEFDRYRTYIKYGNQLRAEFDDDAALASLSVARIGLRRTIKRAPKDKPFSKVAYIVHQFKRKEEVDLFRAVYGRQFFQISVYSRRGARVDYIAQKFANTSNSANINSFRSKAEDIIQIDENEFGNTHGQKVLKIFHDADFIVNLDVKSSSTIDQVGRFCDLLFGSNKISPTRIEYGMFIAKAAALRTLDLSRQVGAAIFSDDGEIVTMGSNEVPKGGGGTYWCDDGVDDREYVRGHDSNDRRKAEIISEILDAIKSKTKLTDPRIGESQFMDALEYGRIVHAEMSAIIDAARLGRSIKDGVLFCTTFPCHMCAKHIVGSGIKRVVFLEPYPKSLVLDLRGDSIIVEGNDRGKYNSYPSVLFEHFYGVSPRRYRDLFERGKRKSGGDFMEWRGGVPRPNLNIRTPYYVEAEKNIVEFVIPQYISRRAFDPAILKK